MKSSGGLGVVKEHPWERGVTCFGEVDHRMQQDVSREFYRAFLMILYWLETSVDVD